MTSIFLLLAAVIIAVAGAQQQNQNFDDDKMVACGMELIWPPSDAIVLMALDSRSVMVYLKLWGNCSVFLSPTPSQLNIQVIIDQKSNALETWTTFASPLDSDSTPIHFRVMRSPLLAENYGDKYLHPLVTSEMHDTSKLFSIWCFMLIYSEQMLNRKGAHDLETLHMVIELYLVSNSTTPDPSRYLSSPSATLRYRLLGNASSHFFPVAPRYSSITGYVCLSACGKICNHKDDIEIVSKRQQELLTAQSPVCTRITQAVNWTLEGPDFTLHSDDDAFFSTAHRAVAKPDARVIDNEFPDEVAVVSIGGGDSGTRGPGHEIHVTGPGRHRLLSVIAAVLLKDSVGYILLKTQRARIDRAHVIKIIGKFDLISSYAFIAFRKRRIDAIHDVDGAESLSEMLLQLPVAHFGSIDDGILLSRAAAEVMLMATMDEAELRVENGESTLPAACSEFLIFSDAWLCWCAAALDVAFIDIQLKMDGKLGVGNCVASSPLYRTLAQLYEQHRLPISGPVSPPFTERTTLGFQYFMRTLVFHLVKGPRILHIPDDEEQGDTLFWDACCGRLVVDYMLLADSLPVNSGLHPVLQRTWGALVSASNRIGCIGVLRGALVSGEVDGRAIVETSMPAGRRRLRLSASAARVLGCSVQNSGCFFGADGDMLRGNVGSSCNVTEPLQLHIITPAVLLMKHGQPVNRQLYLATHEEWSDVFGYNPLFSKDASLAFAAPQFSVQDWYVLCMLAVSSMKGSDVPAFDPRSREHFACNTFASAVSQRTYAEGMPRCFDLPPRIAGAVRYMGSAQSHAQYLKNCQATGEDGGDANDDPWMLRQLAGQVQALLMERWDLQQVCDLCAPCVLYCHAIVPRAGLRPRCTLTAS